MRAWVVAILPLALGPNAGAAELCIVPSAANGANVTVTLDPDRAYVLTKT